MICVIHAHPYLSRSRIQSRAGRRAARPRRTSSCARSTISTPISTSTSRRSRRRSRRRSLVVWMHPLYWYSVPALLKHWFDKVLAFGWAYGEGGTALTGKHCLWVADHRRRRGRPTRRPACTRSRSRASRPPSSRPRASAACSWEPPYVVHGANGLDDARLAGHAAALIAAARAVARARRNRRPTGDRP